MSNSDKNFDKIEDYLFGQMDDAEKKKFEAELVNDKELAADLALHQMEHRGMELLAQEELKKSLNTWKSERNASGDQEAKVVSLNSRRRFFQYAAAAAVVLLAGFFVWTWVGQGPDDLTLAGNYFESTSYANRSNTPDINPLFLPALQALQNQEYDRAIDSLKSISTTEFALQAKLLEGEAHFLKKDYTNAATAFQQAIQQGGDILDVHEAEWRLALTYLAMGERGTPFQPLLNKMVADENHSHHPDAVKLQDELN